ncbi:MAG: tetratricopeptide repeat protein [Bacteroidota bacterium]
MRQFFQLIWIIFLLAEKPCYLSAQHIRLDSLKASFEWQEPDSIHIQTLKAIALAHDDANEYDSLLKYASQMVDLGKAMEKNAELGFAYEKIGASQWHLGHFPAAVSACDSALKYYQLTGNDRRIMTTTHLKGMIHMQSGNFDLATRLYYEAIDLARAEHDSLVVGVILNGVASVHLDMAQYEQAEEAFQESIAMLSGEEYSYRRGMSISNLGTLYHTLRRHEEALVQFRQAISIYQDLGNKRWEVTAKGNMGGTLINMGRAKEAIPFLEENIAFFRDKEPYYESESLGMLARAYTELGQLNKAKNMYQRALAISQKAGMMENERRHHENLSEIANLQQDYRAAFEHVQAANVLTDSLYSIQTAEKVAELTEQYEAEKKEAQIIQLNTENALKDAKIANDKQIKWGLVIGIFLLIIIGVLVWKGQRRTLRNQRLLVAKNEAIRSSEYKQHVTELELKALRAQMNPHFIFNCMNSINRLILEDQNDQASRNLTKFSRLVRMILEHSGKKYISLEEELTMLKTYIQLESQRFKGKIDYEIQVDPDLDPDGIDIPSMILQPFVENAIWHGLMHKEDGRGKIRIQLEAKGEILHCQIEDNGVGRKKALELKQANRPSHQSMAMTVTRERLGLLDQSGLAQPVEIIDLKDASNQALGTRVHVHIPMN